MPKNEMALDAKMGMRPDQRADLRGMPESMDVKIKRAANKRAVMNPKHPMTMSHNTSKMSTGKC